MTARERGRVILVTSEAGHAGSLICEALARVGYCAVSARDLSKAIDGLCAGIRLGAEFSGAPCDLGILYDVTARLIGRSERVRRAGDQAASLATLREPGASWAGRRSNSDADIQIATAPDWHEEGARSGN